MNIRCMRSLIPFTEFQNNHEASIYPTAEKKDIESRTPSLLPGANFNGAQRIRLPRSVPTRQPNSLSVENGLIASYC